MAAESDYRNLFSPEIESVEEFIQRLKMQNGEKLDAAGEKLDAAGEKLDAAGEKLDVAGETAANVPEF